MQNKTYIYCFWCGQHNIWHLPRINTLYINKHSVSS